jgi:hypothetical protein
MERGRAGRGRFRQFRQSVLAARAQTRVLAEVEVRRDDPLSWLLVGPGRERPGEPGWSRSVTVNVLSGPVEIRVVYVAKPPASVPAPSADEVRRVVDVRAPSSLTMESPFVPFRDPQHSARAQRHVARRPLRPALRTDTDE